MRVRATNDPFRMFTDSRYASATIGLLASIAISVLAWILYDTILLFLLIPFVPWLFWRRSSGSPSHRHKRCPRCGFTTADPDFDYCPRDGERLGRPDGTVRPR